MIELEPQTTWVEVPGDPVSYRPDDRVLERLLAYPSRKLVTALERL